MIDECIAKEGRLDVLVNNFGESNPRKDLDITKCTYKEFEKTVCVDLSTVFNACQEALNKAMIKQHSGSIINIGSVAAVCPDRTQVGYGVAKSGINHLSRQMGASGRARRCTRERAQPRHHRHGSRCQAPHP